MNKIVFATFYTEDTQYKEISEKYFKKSVEKYNLDYKILEYPNYKNWNRNVAQKPLAILDTLNSIPEDTCLVFLDADATIEQYPNLFFDLPQEVEIAYHVLRWDMWYNRPKDTTKELLTGTMFFRNNDRVKKLCKEWYDKAIKSSEWEQKVLQKIIDVNDIYKRWLPIEYCFIKTLPGDRKPHIKTEPVILHHQVSRELKRSL